MLGFVLLFCQILQGADKTLLRSPTLLPGPSARAPLTVLNKPLVAEFQSTRAKKTRRNTKVVEFRFRGRFLRNSRGETRTEYYDPGKPGESIAVITLWNPEKHTMTFVSLCERKVQRLKGPIYPDEREWMPGENVVLKPTGEEKILHGLESKRVLLVPVRDTAGGKPTAESWIAFDWGLVLLEVAETATEELRWEVIRVQKIEPDASFFEVPEGLSEN